MYRILGADQKEYGPVSAEQVRQWINERRLNAQSLVMPEGAGSWKPLSLYSEFADDLARANPVAAPTGYYQPVAPYQTTSTNGMAIASLVCGCVSLCCGLGAILGIIFGCVGLSQINKNPYQGGKGMAIAGIILSCVGLVLGIIFAVFNVFTGALLQR